MAAAAPESSDPESSDASSVAGCPAVFSAVGPDSYRHWRLRLDGPIAWLIMVADDHDRERADIELSDAVQRLRFEHPGVRAVVLTNAEGAVFGSGATSRARTGPSCQVALAMFSAETRNAIEDATANSGQTYLAAINGAAAGGGYELALACEQILLIDDDRSTVELGDLPQAGLGGLVRLVEKRGVRRDHADAFGARADGMTARAALDWQLVDEIVAADDFTDTVTDRALAAATVSSRPPDGNGVELTPPHREVTATAISYRQVRAEFDRERGIVTITVRGPSEPAPADVGQLHRQGAAGWLLALIRELDELILLLRRNEIELTTWILRTEGDPLLVLDHERVVLANAGTDWLANEILHYYKRTLDRLDVTGRRLIALIEPGSCFAGVLLELALAADRQYIVDGQSTRGFGRERTSVVVSGANFGAFPMINGPYRLRSRFYRDDEALKQLCCRIDQVLGATEAIDLGLVTGWLADLDQVDDGAATPLTARRFVGPETVQSKIFGQLGSAQQESRGE